MDILVYWMSKQFNVEAILCFMEMVQFKDKVIDIKKKVCSRTQ